MRNSSPTWRLAQRVVSLGRAARESANLKMRQPLAEAIVGLPGPRTRSRWPAWPTPW